MRPLVWVSRIAHCRGFGIQSPTDYWLVRYVINEHWPYYQYEELGHDDDWLTRKLGLLFFRIANWRRPAIIESDGYRDYLHAGCKKALFGDSSELLVLPLEALDDKRMSIIYKKVDNRTVLIVENIWKNKRHWKNLIADPRLRITFDLYYCGIILFDQKRHQQHYIINF
jgi:hypothetical protein